MKLAITLKHYMKPYLEPDIEDGMFALSVIYGIQYEVKGRDNNHFMLFNIKESLEDDRTYEYFRDVLCHIFHTQPANYYFPFSSDHEVSIYTIMLAFVDSVRQEHSDRHYKEVIRKFNHERTIDTSNGMPMIHQLKNGNYCLTPVEYSSYGDFIERFVPERMNGNIQEQSKTRGKNKRAVYRNFSFNDLYESCGLYREFCDGKEIDDTAQLFLIARNLCGAEKGKQQFLNIISNQQSKNLCATLNWKEILTAIIKGNMPLAPCEQCRYCDCCQHAENMLSTAKPQKFEIRRTGKEHYVSIEEVSEELNQAFERAINEQNQAVYIIKAQTGIGKTQTYLNYMQRSEKPLLIAVPTHDLKKEILRKARNMGIKNICGTPDLDDYMLSDDLKRRIDDLYTVGAGEYVLKYLTMQLKRLKHTDSDYIQISAYLNDLKRAYRSNGHMITTHARLMHMKQEILDSYEVIIDEDILRTAINANSFHMDELKFVRNSGMFDNNDDIVNLLDNNRYEVIK